MSKFVKDITKGFLLGLLIVGVGFGVYFKTFTPYAYMSEGEYCYLLTTNEGEEYKVKTKYNMLGMKNLSEQEQSIIFEDWKGNKQLVPMTNIKQIEEKYSK